MTKPALLIDVDGVLDPYAGDDDLLIAQGYRNHPERPFWIYDPQHGSMLGQFAVEHDFELVWCTYRNEDANRYLSPVYGFDQLAQIAIPDGPTQLEYETEWKYQAVLDWAGDRPIAWLDDEHGEHGGFQATFLQARRAPTKLVTVDPALGLLPEHLEEIVAWKEMVL